MRVFVAGGTGAIGRLLVEMLSAAGHDVVGLARSRTSAQELQELGAEPALADALDDAALRHAVVQSRPDAVVNQLTSIPDRINPRRVGQDMAATNELRTRATRTLMAAAEEAGATRVVSQSIAFVYDPHGTGLAAEDEGLYLRAPTSFRHLVAAVDASERAALGSERLNGIVLRYGLFYGPGTSYAADGSFAGDVRRRSVPIVGGGGGVTSFVHVRDAAAATVCALERGAPGVYNVVDDEPAPVRDWLPAYAELLGAAPPRRVPRLLGLVAAGRYGVYFMTRTRGASNRRARTELAWAPRYPSWRDGFRAELTAATRRPRPGVGPL